MILIVIFELFVLIIIAKIFVKKVFFKNTNVFH